MKKIFSLLSTIAFFTIGAEAQNVDDNPILSDDATIRRVPAEFTSDGQVQFWMEKGQSKLGEKVVAVFIDEDLNEKKRFDINGSVWMRYKDLNQLYNISDGFYMCQTLFNTDDKYEYIEPVISVIDDRERATGFKIISEGAILQTVNFPDGFACYYDDVDLTIIKIGNKLYLNIEEVYGSDNEYYELMYKINPAASSVTMVRQDCVGKMTRKVYDKGRFFIEDAEGNLYRADGVEAVRE